MRFGEFEFRFRPLPTVLMALAVPLLLSLGFWQLHRADQKREQARLLLERSELPPLDVTGLIADPSTIRHRRVRLRGEFEATGQLFIENRRLGGRNGFHVVTPLRLSGSDVRVLVNRGWLPAGEGVTPIADVPAGTVEVNGEVDIPSPPALVLHGGEAAVGGWADRWPYLTTDLFASTVSYPVQPFTVLQDPTDAHGFERSWPKEPPKEGMHIGYAIQWFAFAAIALGIHLRLSLRPNGEQAP